VDELWINQGGLQGGTVGTFAPSASVFIATDTRRVTMGDVDGDADLDLIASGRLGAANIIWLNDGAGQFSYTDTIEIADLADSYAIAAGDVNNDDDLDLVIGYNFEDAPNRIWRNNSAPQIMNIDLPATVEEGSLITMGVTISSTDSPLEMLTLEMDWGDGTTTTLDFPAGQNVLYLPHYYANNRPDEDPYLIQLLVKDPENGIGNASTNLIVTNIAPSLESWTLNSPISEGETATLNGEMFDPGADELVLSLNWGEGMQEVHHFPAGTTAFSLTHTYLDDNPSGTPSDPYTVSMILLDEDLDLDQGEASLIVQNLDPQATAGPDQEIDLGTAITLAGAFTDPGSEDTHIYWWDLGDGTIISDTMMLTHTYATGGAFSVTFYVVDDDTGMATSTVHITVSMNLAENSPQESIPFQTLITPPSGWQVINWRELFNYRDLLYFLVLRDIKVVYKQTVLGFAWAIIRPFMSMVIFTIIFGNIAQVSSDGVPYPLFSYVALVPWTYFSTSMIASTNSLVGNTGMLTKIYFPRLVFPLAPVFANLVDFAIAFGVIGVLLVIFQWLPTYNVIFLPLLVVLMMLTATGIGMWLSALAIQYRDVRHAMTFVSQAMMYAAPVVWPVSSLVERFGETAGYLYALYPMVGVIEGFRSAILGTTPMPWAYVGIGFVSSLVVAISGAYYFKRMERVFADVA